MSKFSTENSGTKDVLNGLSKSRLALYLAISDIRQRYRRSSLGPFWITISTGVMISCIGFIFGGLFKTPMAEFLPFLTIGLIAWTFISSTLVESTTVFVSSESIIKQLPLPLSIHVARMVFRNVYIFFHNLIIYPIVCFIFNKSVSFFTLLFIPGFIILLLNLLWMSLFLSIVCSRFRDLTQIVNSLLQVIFYITPIIWLPSLLPARAKVMVLDFNPFYHLIEIIRLPLLSQPPTAYNWLVSISLIFIGWSVSLLFFNKYRNRIPYWL